MKEYEVLKGIIPLNLIDDVLRLIHLDFAQRGLSKREIDWWNSQSSWYPHFRFSEEVSKLAGYVPERFQTGVMCEPQILASLPEEYDGDLFAHTDEEPDWAEGRKYKAIVGIPLTKFTEKNGGVRLFTKQDGIITPELGVGDLLYMHPNLAHSRGINRSGEIRYAVYFRWLEEST